MKQISFSHIESSIVRNKAFSQLMSTDCLQNTSEKLCKERCSLKSLVNFKRSLQLPKRQFSKKDSDTDVFLWNLLNFRNNYLLFWRTSANDCSWYCKKSYWTTPLGFCILTNVYEFFKFSSLDSISCYANTSSTSMHLHYIWKE